MLPEDIHLLRSAGDPRVSPDGSAVAYVVTEIDKEENTYRSAIWLARADGSTPPKKLTAGTKRDGSPRWSPDGTRLAFTSNRDGDVPQLYVLPLDGGDAVKLTDLKEGPGDPVWSPDGTRIAFTARVRDEAYEEEDDRKRRPRRFTRLRFKLDNEGWIGDRRQHLFVVPADASAAPTQLTDGDFDDASPSWSPDGTRIVFSAPRDEDWDIRDSTDLHVVEAAGGEPARLTPGDGAYGSPTWSPDGSMIAALFTPGLFDWPRHARVVTVDPSSGAVTALTESLDRNCQPFPPLRSPCWEDGTTIMFGVEDRGNTHLYRVASDGSGKPEQVVGGEQAVVGFDAAAGTLATVRTTTTTLPELFIGEDRITDVGAALMAARAPIATERFTATSADGTEVDAWFLAPPDAAGGARVPLLLSIHGGPFTQYGNRFFDEFQVYARAGYAVVFSNPRGSSGSTEEFGRAIRGPGEAGPGMGSVDAEDLHAVVDEALRRYPICDPDRVGVIGGSYGGFMTSWLLGHSGRFATGISERAVNSWVSMWGSSDIGWEFKGYVGTDLHSDHDAWRAMSPLTYAPDIRTPLLILHSENDLRCNIEQGEQLFTSLRLLEREVEMVRFPAEGHELSRAGSPAHREMRFEVILEWFARTLRGDR